MKELVAIVKKNVSHRVDKGSQISIASFLFVLLFFVILGITFSRVFFGIFNNSIVSYDLPVSNKVIVINPTDEWMEFVDIDNSVDGKQANYSYLYFGNDDVYDVKSINKMMKEQKSNLCIVFDGNDILTYYPSDRLEYTVKKNEFKENILKDYETYVNAQRKTVQLWENSYKLSDRPLSKQRSFVDLILICSKVEAIILFIFVLFFVMKDGTHLIAGAKEDGSFAMLILTPVSRAKIVLGHILGVWFKSLVPTIFILLFSGLFLLRIYKNLYYVCIGLLLPAFIYVSMFAFLITSIVILISMASKSVVSAQTMFLPVFFIILMLCISLLQENNYSDVYRYFPVYGQYIGVSEVLAGDFSLVKLFCSSVLTIIASLICITVSIRFIDKEKFIFANYSEDVDSKSPDRLKHSVSGNEVEKVKKSVFGYIPKTKTNTLTFILSQIIRPVAILVIIQTLAIIPAFFMMSGKRLSEIFEILKNIRNFSSAFAVSSDIMSLVMNSKEFIFFLAVGYVVMILCYIIKVKVYEENPISSLGFKKKNAFKHYFMGIVTGFMMMGMVYMILFLTGQVRISEFGVREDQIILFVIYMMMWIVQGATEEIMFRGYMFSRISAKFGVIPALLFSSFLFCIMHGINPGFSVIAFINLILISVLFALIAYYMDSIWLLCACHSMWNFMQGNFFGLQVSGTEESAILIHSSYKENSLDIWTGGKFGPEGGFAVTITLVVFLILTVLLRKKLQKQQIQE